MHFQTSKLKCHHFQIHILFFFFFTFMYPHQKCLLLLSCIVDVPVCLISELLQFTAVLSHTEKKKTDWLFSLHEPPSFLLHSFNMLCSTEVHFHAWLCKLRFLLNTMLNCRHMLDWSWCPSEKHRLFWNQQRRCQAPTLSPPPHPPGCKPEPSPSLGHQHQMAEPVTELGEKMRGGMRKRESMEK